jgi:Na+-transporting NADH:ubiquinone oxidoreductase subunit C
VSSRDSTKKTLLVAFCLCLVCSIVVSATAVILKPRQDANRILDRNKNILSAAGMFDAGQDGDDVVEQRFKQFQAYVVDLNADSLLSSAQLQQLQIDIGSYDQRLLINDPNFSETLDSQSDIADIKRRVIYPMIYVVAEQGEVETIVVPVNGYGLWGILYGYLALEGDANTVKGLAFYELKETPGLGAEVRNPNWMALWPGKKIYNDQGEVGLRVIKGQASAENEIDGLSGATLTTRGVDNLIQYWLGEDGYGPVLSKIRSEGVVSQ